MMQLHPCIITKPFIHILSHTCHFKFFHVFFPPIVAGVQLQSLYTVFPISTQHLYITATLTITSMLNNCYPMLFMSCCAHCIVNPYTTLVSAPCSRTQRADTKKSVAACNSLLTRTLQLHTQHYILARHPTYLHPTPCHDNLRCTAMAPGLESQLASHVFHQH